MKYSLQELLNTVKLLTDQLGQYERVIDRETAEKIVHAVTDAYNLKKGQKDTKPE